MDGWRIRTADRSDLAQLDMALAELSRELGDPHRTDVTDLERALFGTPPLAWANVGEGAHGLCGAVLFAPVFSTARGGAGVFVSDLWVDASRRGSGLGRALLGNAAQTAVRLWNASFVRLTVHDANVRARSLYERLGFEAVTGETAMVLTGQAFQEVRRAT